MNSSSTSSGQSLGGSEVTGAINPSTLSNLGQSKGDSNQSGSNPGSDVTRSQVEKAKDQKGTEQAGGSHATSGETAHYDPSLSPQVD
jgi:hypothetical protein